MIVVYAICSGDAVKFGVTAGLVQSRLNDLQTGNARTLGIAAEYPSEFAYELEAAIFDSLSAHRIRGEWYFPADAVLELVEVMRGGNLDDYLSRDLEDVRPQNWRSLARQAESRRKYMKKYMRDFRRRKK